MKDVIVLSSTQQEFLGLPFYKCGQYFQKKGVKLHTLVYHAYNGPLSKGYEVHHIDKDKYNNLIVNLIAIPTSIHAQCHRTTDTAKEALLLAPYIKLNVELLAKEWWKTRDGIQYRKRVIARLTDPKQKVYVEVPCLVCDTVVQKSKAFLQTKTFCSNACKLKFYKKRKMHVKPCAVCHTDFYGNPDTKTCSEECRAELIASSVSALCGTKTVTRTCSQCATVYQGSHITNCGGIYLCSTECRELWNYKEKPTRAIQHCIICGDEICDAKRESRFCSGNCYSKYRRANKLDYEDRVCIICGSSFSTSKYGKTKTCSTKCRGALHSRTSAANTESVPI